MAKNYYNGPLTMDRDWGGNEEKKESPATGQAVQKFIKDELKKINKKAGFIDRVNTKTKGFYVLTTDETAYREYLKTITPENEMGDIHMPGVIGTFDAPFEYKMNIEMVSPKNGETSSLYGDEGNEIVFKVHTENSSGAIQNESVGIVYKIECNGQVEQYTRVYGFEEAKNGIVFNLDGKLSKGKNNITILANGKTTDANAMYTVEYNVVEIYLIDDFDSEKFYTYDENDLLTVMVIHSYKGIGDTSLYWYIDGELLKKESLGANPNVSNKTENLVFNWNSNRLEPGVHSLQMYLECNKDGKVFKTDIHFREFFVDKNIPSIKEPLIARRFDLKNEGEYSIVGKGESPVIKNITQYETFPLDYSVYYFGKKECTVEVYANYNNTEKELVSSKNIMLIESVSGVREQILLKQFGDAQIIISPIGGAEGLIDLEIEKNEADIKTDNEGVMLYLNAFGKSNESQDRETWEYLRKYDNKFSYNKIDISEVPEDIIGTIPEFDIFPTKKDGNNDYIKFQNEYYLWGNTEELITTEFSKNRYVEISPSELIPAFSGNTLTVETIPDTQQEEYDYLKTPDGKYYIWEKEFEWSETSGWNDGGLKIAEGNSITINMKPFNKENISTISSIGLTYEIEFKTYNVDNDNAVICKICGKENDCPGIIIKASSAELVVSRDLKVIDGETTEYINEVSTKYKAGEKVRISFVIWPDLKSSEYRNRILRIYVNGVLSGAERYPEGSSFFNDSKITFKGTKETSVELYSLKFYSRALKSEEILNNFIYYQNNIKEKISIYNRNNILLPNEENYMYMIDAKKLKTQLPVMTFYQKYPEETIELLKQEKKNKKLPVHFDIVYEDMNNPRMNFVLINAMVTPQGTSSMNYPIKNFRFYTKKDKKNPGTLYAGENVSLDNLDPSAVVSNKRYSFREGDEVNKTPAPVDRWCLKADFAESSSSHNTGVARYWNDVLVNAGLKTNAQRKAESAHYKYDVRTCVDGFPIMLFYKRLDDNPPEFVGKYNFNNDKSSEDVFGFTGGPEIEGQGYTYYYIGTRAPWIYSEINEETQEREYACTFNNDGTLDELMHPTEESALYFCIKNPDGIHEKWYKLKGPEMFDNPKMECWEFRNSTADIGLFKSMEGYTRDPKKHETIGVMKNNSYTEAFESRFPDGGDYSDDSNLYDLIKWLVSTRYLKINEEGKTVPFEVAELPDSKESLTIHCQSTDKLKEKFHFDFPGKKCYKITDNLSGISEEGYKIFSMTAEQIRENVTDENSATFDNIPTVRQEGITYVIHDNKYYVWTPANYKEVTSSPIEMDKDKNFKYLKYNGDYYFWDNEYSYGDFQNPVTLPDSPENRALKFFVEKWDHFDMQKVAAYYIYLLRFGAVDQTVKNAMITTEGSGSLDPLSELPDKWYFINYDNDTILGVKNDGRLVFDPYITRDTKDGEAFAYAGRESTLWNNLEADVEFNQLVAVVDGLLASGNSEEGGTVNRGLSYKNTIRQFETLQTNKWCETIYNIDAEVKYINTWVIGWKTKYEDKVGYEYDDYLYDIHGNRNAHRRWWVSRRFNILDSKFANSNYKKMFIGMRSDDLPAGKTFTITSGEPIYYAWGHDNSIVEMTDRPIQPNESYTFKTPFFINVGSPIEIYGAPNILKIDIRDSMANMARFDISQCYTEELGTKLKEVIIGDHNNHNIKTETSSSFKFVGLQNAKKLEVLDLTNVTRLQELTDLNLLINLKELYTYNTSLKNITLGEGSRIKILDLPKELSALKLSKSPDINFEHITCYNEGFSGLTNLTELSIDNCPQLITDYEPILSLIKNIPENKRRDFTLSLIGIDWEFSSEYSELKILEEINKNKVLTGTISIDNALTESDIVDFKRIFAPNCFIPGAALYIKARPSIYINGPSEVYEGDNEIEFNITTVGVEYSTGNSIEIFIRDSNNEKVKLEDAANDIVINKDIENNKVIIKVKESNNSYKDISLRASCIVTREDGVAISTLSTLPHYVTINKRKYPTNAEIYGDSAINDINTHTYTLKLTPEIGENESGAGFYNVEWKLSSENNDHQDKVFITGNTDNCKILSTGFDGVITLSCEIIKRWNDQKIESCSKSFDIIFLDPDTIITKETNFEAYNILLNAGVINESTKYKLTKPQASYIVLDDLMTKDANPHSIFQDSNIAHFDEFKYFLLIKELPKNFFKGCKSLTSVSLPNLLYIGESAFEECEKLSSVSGAYDNTVEVQTIEKNAFKNCKKLNTIQFNNTLKNIKEGAFNSCRLFNDFHVFSGLEKIFFTENETPFINCPNIAFTGGQNEIHTLKDGTKLSYKVTNGNLYEYIYNDDESINKINLIHMGKDTNMESLINGNDILACAYSMEYRIENDVNVPNNIILNGKHIFDKSEGNSITLNRKLDKPELLSQLFSKTNYGNNYYFSTDETIMPSQCFYENSFVTNLTFENTNIKTIGNQCFRGCGNLNKIIFPSTLEKIGNSSFWLTKLKKMYLNSPNPPSIFPDEFFHTELDGIYIDPTFYETYKNGIEKMFVPYLRPNKLYDEGYVRIIEGHSIKAPSTYINDISIGEATNIVSDKNGYVKYFREGNNSENISINLNKTSEGTSTIEKVGEVREKYTTIYINIDENLFEGNGLNFTKGFYKSSKMPFETKGEWVYDPRFKGLLVKNKGTFTFKTKAQAYLGKYMEILFGHYAHQKNELRITNDSNTEGEDIININNYLKYDFKKLFLIGNSGLKITYVNNMEIIYGPSSIIINKIGDAIYSDPELTSDIQDNLIPFIVTVNLTDELIGAPIVITDGITTIYRKRWNGTSLTFNLPNKNTFSIYGEEFLSQNGKYYEETEHTPLSEIVEDNIIINYDKKIGLEEEPNYYIAKTANEDFYVLKKDNEIQTWENATNIASNFKFSDETIIFRLPDRREIDIITANIPVLNNGDAYWTSEEAGADNAYLSNNIIQPKASLNKFIIIGKKMGL